MVNASTMQRELERALGRRRPAGDGYSVRQLMKLTTWGEERVHKALRALLEAGAWEVVQIRVMGINGIARTSCGYRPKANGRQKKG